MASTTSSTTPVLATAIAAPPRFTGLDIALIISMGFWGSNYVVAKYATDVMPPMVYNVLRFSVAVLCTYAFVRIRKVDLRLPRREWWPVIRAAILAYGIYQPFFIYGLQLTTAGNAALILTAGPIWVVLLNAMRGRDRITRSIVTGVLIALGGVLVVVLGRFAGKLDFGGTSLIGDAMELIASVLWGLGTMATSYPLGRSVNTVENGGNGSNPMTISFWILFIGGCTQLLYGWPSFIGLKTGGVFTPTVVIALLVSAICAVTFGTMVGNVAIGRRGASRTVIYNYMQPFVAALLGALFLGEVFTPWLIVGGVLIALGVWMVRRS